MSEAILIYQMYAGNPMRMAEEIVKLRGVIKDIAEGKSSTYRAGNGHQVGIEADVSVKAYFQ